MSDLSAGQIALDQLDERVRRLGATLHELGWDAALQQLADQLPEACERLGHVGALTEAAADKVLNLIDAAQPACRAAAADADALSARLAGLAVHPDLGVGEARAALAEAAAALQHQAVVAGRQGSVLAEILLAQDFQDRSGQVIRKVIGIIGQAEQQLRQLLAQAEGPGGAVAAGATLQGPQVPDEAVAQQDVDDLRAAMGF